MSDPVRQDGTTPAADSLVRPQPMTGTLMARLFIVPAIIVCVLLAVAVVVVFFGSTSIEHQETVADLLTRLESDTGDRTMGTMLMPKAKEYWQAAQELAQRLGQKEKFLKAEEIEPTAARIIAILAKFPPGQDVDEAGADQQKYLTQQYFMMMALAQLKSPTAVEPLVKLLNDPYWGTRRTALQALADMGSVAVTKQALPAVLALLDDRRPAVQLVACAAVASLADRGDAVAIRALAAKLEGDREVQWNAAMTLARLGDRHGKLILMNMLDRGYWEKLDLEYTEDTTVVRRKYSDVEVANNLVAAIGAAANLKDTELAGLISKLQEDRAVMVRDAARAATTVTAMKKAELGADARLQIPGRVDSFRVTMGEVS